MATTAEVRTRALRRLGVLGRGQTARAEDNAELDQAYKELYADLEVKGLTTWGNNTADVPDRFVDPISALLAAYRVEEFSVPPAKYQRIMEAAYGRSGNKAENRIRELQSVGKNAPTKIENY